MKTFSQFQEDMSKLPGLGGGGGGTDSISAVSKSKSIKKRVGDAGKILTRPFHKKRVDPTEKFATEGVASLAVKGSNKLIPALMTGIGAAGTIMQSKKRKISDMSDDEIARKGPGDQLANVPKRKRDIFRKGLKDLIKPRFGETEKFKAG